MELENDWAAAGGTIECTIECAMDDCDSELRCKWGDPAAEGASVEKIVQILREEWIATLALDDCYVFICPDCV